jgi:quercetin dioxygenase-like cupin family protein
MVDMPPGVEVDEHVHDREDQIMVVISGTIGGHVNGETFELTDGGVALIPRGSRHGLWNRSGAMARVLDMYTPGGMEQFFVAAGENAAGGEATKTDYAAAGAQS